MALNKLVGGDCGGNNNLVQLSSIVSRDGTFNQMSQADRFVQEFSAQNSQLPQTFNMNNLLHSINNVETKNQMTMSLQQPINYGPTTSHIPYQPLMPQFQFLSSNQYGYAPPTNVQIQYINESEISVNSTPKFQTSEEQETYDNLMSFMKKITSGDVGLNNTDENMEHRKLSRDEQLNEMAEKYKEEWKKLSEVEDFWPTEPKIQNEEYEFSEGNVMLENKNALELGKERLNMGDVPGAVLCFEAAVQQQPDSVEAWTLLGQTQSENEKDPQAIAALKKALELEPLQLAPYITLAAAYTNENFSNLALLTIYRWIQINPMYSNLLPTAIDPEKLENIELQKLLKNVLIKAAQQNPVNIDAEVQNAFGVIFNITQEYDKAVDCFKTALAVRSDDSKLWNRLGATLANGNRSEEAVDAYQRALQLEPGFVRARYNVGITCMNLGAHRQAAEHFLEALNQQAKAKTMFPDTSISNASSSTIWNTLRMVCSFLGEYDATKFVDDQNIEQLNKIFQIQ